jgi:hypothetical protein
MAEPVCINPNSIHHFAFDPLGSASHMAQVNVEGVLIFSQTYFLTGREVIIPANGGQILAFLCHVPSSDHWIHPNECSLLKYVHDPWYACTCLLLTNTHPEMSLLAPAYCDIYALVQNTSVDVITVADADFYAFIDN